MEAIFNHWKLHSKQQESHLKKSISSNEMCVTLLCAWTPKHLCAQAALDPLRSNLRGFRDSFTVYALIPHSPHQMCVCE